MPGNQWGRPGGELPNPFVGEVERQRKQRAAVVIGGATVAVLVVVGLILAFALGRGSGGDGAAEADAADGPVSGTADRPAELTDTGWEGTSAVCAGDDPWFYAAQGFDTNRVVICLHDEGDPSDPQGRTTYFHDENTEDSDSWERNGYPVCPGDVEAGEHRQSIGADGSVEFSATSRIDKMYYEPDEFIRYEDFWFNDSLDLSDIYMCARS